mgnify:CR=1 FL=1
MKYKHVIFDNRDDYFVTALSDVKKVPDVQIYRYELDGRAKILRYMYQVQRRVLRNTKLEKLLHKCWHPTLFRNNSRSSKPICFVISAKYHHFVQNGYLSYLRRHYSNCKIVLFYRDTIAHQKRAIPDLDIQSLKNNCDLILTANRFDAEQYGMVKFDSFCSNVPVDDAPDYPLSDVMFVGLAKDRLDTLHKAYKLFTEAGLKCDFYITGVPAEKRLPNTDIVYADRPMSYREMLYRTKNSRCLLEVTQGGSDGYTSRFFEALCYNKLLITDNKRVSETKFYNPEFIQLYSSPDEIDTSFIKDDSRVNYNYQDEYSPIRMLELIERELAQL